jgi:Raf kinase inhibitor-like YbhB/YbcL family protein
MVNRTLISVAAALSCVATSYAIAAGTTATSDPQPAVALLRSSTRLTVSSVSFRDNGTLPVMYTQNGYNWSPPLSWTAGPKGTKSYVVLVEDTGVRRAEPIVHWVMYDIPADTTALPERLGTKEKLISPMGALQGKNIAKKIGYIGPKPPAGETHPYHFEVFALDQTLKLSPDTADRDAVVNAMKGHVLAAGELVATYAGKGPAKT